MLCNQGKSVCVRYSLEASSLAKYAAVHIWALTEHYQGPLMWLVPLVRLITLRRHALVCTVSCIALLHCTTK